MPRIPLATRLLVGFVLPATVGMSAPGAARAHAVLEPREAAANAGYRGVVRIMHGCAGAATTRVTVTIPDGMVGAKPMPKPGWTVTTTRGSYGRVYQSLHGQVSEGVKTISWSGGSLPDDQVDEFLFVARISDAFAPGSAVPVPVVQDCTSGRIAWDEVAAHGQDAHALKSPAPVIRFRAAGADAPHAAGIRTGIQVVQLWLRATPGGASVAAGYVQIINSGSTPDRLVGATLEAADRGEIHSMSTENGGMRMAPVEGGLALAPGASVELNPGGLHLMFTDLKRGLVAGETVAGTLVFEKAGSLPVTFAVAPIGARAPAAATASEHGAHQH